MSLDPKTQVKVDLTIEDIDFVITALGEMPAKTNAFGLIMKIRAQVMTQIPQEPQVQDAKSEDIKPTE